MSSVRDLLALEKRDPGGTIATSNRRITIRPLTILAAALLVLAATRALGAQTCAGLAPFSAGPVQISVTRDFASDAKALSGGFVLGSPRGAFGGLVLGRISYDDFEGRTTAVGASFGWQVPLHANDRAWLCPGFGIAMGFGPDDINGSGSELSTHSAFFGLQAGISAGADPDIRFVPTVGAAFAVSRRELDGGDFDGAEEADAYGIITLGVGLVVRSTVSVLPSLDIAIGRDSAKPTFGVMVAVTF